MGRLMGKRKVYLRKKIRNQNKIVQKKSLVKKQPASVRFYRIGEVFLTIHKVLPTKSSPERSCVSYVYGLKNERGLNKLEFIVDECTQWFESFMSAQPNPYHLTDDEIMAIGLYT